MFERRLFFHVDWLLLTAILLIAGIGAAMIYSTTYERLPDGTGHAGREFWTQLYALSLGGVALLICLTIDYRILAEHVIASAERRSHMYGQDAVHGPDRAVIDALVEQGGVDFGRSQIGKARLAQPVEHRVPFFGRQRAGRARSGRGRRQWGGPTRAVAIDSGARHAQGVAGGGGEAIAGRQGDHRFHHGSSSLSGVARGIPSKDATFFGCR